MSGASTSVLRALGLIVAAVVALSWLALAAMHWDDFYRSDPAAGVILALVQLADKGQLYPPLFDGTHFGATRYMPLPVVLGDRLGDLTGDVIEGVKLITYMSTVALVALVAVVLRRMGVGFAVIAIVLASVLVSWVGLHTTLVSPRDVLPLFIQLGAVALVARSTGAKTSVAAGVLCGLAFLAKFNAVWAGIAIICWLLLRARRSLPGFVASLLATITVGGVLAEIASDGRFVDNFRDVLVSGSTDLGSIAKIPTKFPELAQAAIPASLLIPVAAVAVVYALLDRRRLTLFHVAFVAALAVLLLTLGDPGAGSNHYLDVLVLAAVLAAALTVEPGLAMPQRHVVEVGLLAVLTWSVTAQYQVDMKEDLQNDIRSRGKVSAADDTRLVAERVSGVESILSDDANIEVVLDRQPVVLDSYLFKYLAPNHPEWTSDLEGRVRRREFGRIVMLEGAGAGPPWPFGFGPSVDAAIASAYRPVARIGGYGIYAPRQP